MSKTLLQKNTRYLLAWLPLVLLFASIIFFIMLQMHAKHMQEKFLLLKQKNVWSKFEEKGGIMERSIQGEYEIRETAEQISLIQAESRDTIIMYGDQSLPFRALTILRKWDGKSYLTTTFSSKTEINHLVIKVFLAEALTLALLMIAIVILNRRSSNKLWHPFFSTMEKINEFDISRNQSLSLEPNTGTREFDHLNQAIQEMTQKVNQAYRNQKQFVENASHEMQTPLAVIRSKLELLINQPNLTEKSAAMLGEISEANDRLSQMSRTLLFLAKIENNQFPKTEDINISILVAETMKHLKDHYEEFPNLSFRSDPQVIIHANRSLIEMLISNLAKNAVVHNKKNGKIEISLNKDQLVIGNSGVHIEGNPEELFDRFKKGSPDARATGLGLALVKQICNLYQFRVNYSYSNEWHEIRVLFA